MRAADGHFSERAQTISRPMALPFVQPDGTIDPILCSPAAEFGASVAMAEGCRLGVIAIAVRGPGKPVGIFSTFTAAELHTVAEQLIKMAEMIDALAGRKQ